MGSYEGQPPRNLPGKTMDRQAILDKIAAMLRLQQSSSFDGESAAAAAMIDKLCAKYGVTVEDATKVQILDEVHNETKRLSDADFILFCAVARFYDAKGYVFSDYAQGRKVSQFKCIGSEAQQIQTRLYYDFFKDVMKKECDKAMKGELILAELTGQPFDKAGFRSNFYKSFALRVKDRLDEMKATREPHEHKDATAVVVAERRFGHKRIGSASGWGGALGSDAGSNVSLNRQATAGRQTLQLRSA